MFRRNKRTAHYQSDAMNTFNRIEQYETGITQDCNKDTSKPIDVLWDLLAEEESELIQVFDFSPSQLATIKKAFLFFCIMQADSRQNPCVTYKDDSVSVLGE